LDGSELLNWGKADIITRNNDAFYLQPTISVWHRHSTALEIRHRRIPGPEGGVSHKKKQQLQPGAIRRNFSQTAKKSFK
jgi:hypothetical protein